LTDLGLSITIVPVANVNQEVMKIIDGVLGIHTQELSPGKQARDFEGWDSLNCVRIMMALEAHFKIRFTLMEIESIEYLEDLFAAVARKLAPLS